LGSDFVFFRYCLSSFRADMLETVTNDVILTVASPKNW
jgi:hypothetical protein